MSFMLPERFAEGVNKLVDHLDQYDRADADAVRDEYLRRALIQACRLLKSLDLYELSDRIYEIFSEANQNDPDWFRSVFGSDRAFEDFLLNVETTIFRDHGLSAEAQRRILELLRKAKSWAKQIGESPESGCKVREALAGLQSEICKRMDEKLSQARRNELHRQVTKALGLFSVMFNAVASPHFPDMAALAAASVSAGGAVSYLR